MELNPYASFLGTLDARTVLPATPGLLHQAACALTPEQADAAIAPGKWSVRQIAAHMADCELVFSFRLRQTLAEDAPTIQPFDQDRWARHYAGYDLPSGLELFRANREWNLKLLADLGAADLARPMTHPGAWHHDLPERAGDHGRPRPEPSRTSPALRRASDRLAYSSAAVTSRTRFRR